MIRAVNIKDLEKINELGIKFITNFKTTYNVESYLNNENYIILLNETNMLINAFLIIYKNLDFYELEAIYVDEEERKKGVATSLLKYFFDALKPNDQILLEVAVNNETAINLYKKFNFEIINVRKKYYKDIDAYVMKKVI